MHPDGLGRLLVRDQSLVGPGDTSRLLQRLQELGNYRNVALLGLPLAQQQGPALAQLEQQLTLVARDIAAGGIADETLLQKLSVLAADLTKMTAETRFRFGATRAYSQLVADRLQAVQVRRVPGFQTLIDFTERRLVPAVRTCESFSQRLDDLATRVSWASSMMRTRIETTLERQSRDLLESMNQRASAQLRLQQTVEGLSVMAISYYAADDPGRLVHHPAGARASERGPLRFCKPRRSLAALLESAPRLSAPRLSAALPALKATRIDGPVL